MSLLYLHFKGGLYVADGAAHDCTNANERTVMRYRDVIDGEPFVRTLSEFDEQIPWPDGVVRPRFLGIETLEDLTQIGVPNDLAFKERENHALRTEIGHLNTELRILKRKLATIQKAMTED